jgi:hypothetical protein
MIRLTHAIDTFEHLNNPAFGGVFKVRPTEGVVRRNLLDLWNGQEENKVVCVP